MLPPETADYENWELSPDTVYYLAPGRHDGSFSANRGDVFVGGYADGVGSTLDGRYDAQTAIDSNITTGEQGDVTIRVPDDPELHAAGRPDGDQPDRQPRLEAARTARSPSTSPAGGIFAASDAVIRDSCLTLNGQYGFQSAQTLQGDSLTGGPYNVWVERNEISYNDTCGLSGLLQNPALGWVDHNPVPAKYRNAHCGKVTGSGNQGGFKLWGTNGVMMRDNWIHHNWGVGGWVDTQQRKHHLDREHDHGQRERWDLGGDVLQLLDHRQLPRSQQPPGRPGQPRLPDAGHLRVGVGKRHQERRRARVHHALLHRVEDAGLPRQVSHREQHLHGQRWRGLPVAELQPSLQRRVRQRVHAPQGRRAGTVQCCRLRQEPPPGHAGPLDLRGHGRWFPAPGLLGRLPVADAERHRHAQPHRLQPGEHRRLHPAGLAGLRRERGVQPVRRPERLRRGGGHPDPDHLLPGQQLVRQRLPRPVDVLRLEPGEPAEPGQLGRVDRSRRRG